ncbi:SAV_6107 family HEPN domain-containing protein [Rhodococcus sp. BE178]|uniref:SAV_6107 family HEPN domain-containing protein n=1 Tax=Rhodococcus sp. BE178 TaxID=2817737 RepID=UPI003D225649
MSKVVPEVARGVGAVGAVGAADAEEVVEREAVPKRRSMSGRSRIATTGCGSSGRPAVSGSPVGPAGPVSAPMSAVALLRRADGLLSEAAGAVQAAERFRCAYLGALRGAAAVLAGVEGAANSGRARRPRSRSAWVLMARAAPDFVEWADYFAQHSALRASIEAGVTRTVTDADADAFYFEVGRFLTAVEDRLGATNRGAVSGLSA